VVFSGFVFFFFFFAKECLVPYREREESDGKHKDSGRKRKFKRQQPAGDTEDITMPRV